LDACWLALLVLVTNPSTDQKLHDSCGEGVFSQDPTHCRLAPVLTSSSSIVKVLANERDPILRPALSTCTSSIELLVRKQQSGGVYDLGALASGPDLLGEKPQLASHLITSLDLHSVIITQLL
jgi:hypothetical protein